MRRVLMTAALTVLVIGCATERPDGNADEVGAESTYDLQTESVPANLRHLIALAEKWGIGDDVERGEFIESATAEERQELIDAITPYQGAITAWLDTFGTNPLSDEAAAFLYMQLAVEEMPN